MKKAWQLCQSHAMDVKIVSFRHAVNWSDEVWRF